MIDAVVFPGQGSQRPGMAKDFCDRWPIASQVFEEASDALGLDIAALSRAEDGRLDLTENTQPCVLTAELAMIAALREHLGFAPERYGGHSLGEYTALVAAGALRLGAAVRLVRRRGQLMQNAVPVGEGGMVALILDGIDVDAVAGLAADAGVDVANLNSPSQVVLSGGREGLARATVAFEAGFAAAGGRAVPLEVSAPFHSRALAVVEPAFRSALDDERRSLAPEHARAVTSNYTGSFHDGTEAGLVESLVRQISAPVRWVDNMRLVAEGGARVIEVGPGRPLTRFFKDVGVTATSIVNLKAAEKVLASS